MNFFVVFPGRYSYDKHIPSDTKDLNSPSGLAGSIG